MNSESNRSPLKRTLKTAAKSLAYFAGGHHIRARLETLRRPGRKLLVLVYHNLADPHTESDLERRLFRLRPVTPAAHFDCLIEVLARSYRVVDLATGARELQESPNVNQLSVAITFDDGYRAFLTRALPVLERHGFPATVFLATDYLDSAQPFWWDELTQLVANVNLGESLWSAAAELIGVPAAIRGDESSAPVTGHSLLLSVLEQALAKMPTSTRTEVMGRLRDLMTKHGAKPAVPVPLLSWDEVRELTGRRITFGAHTCSHLNMAGAPPEQVEREIGESVRRLKQELHAPVDLFAYPYGMQPEAYRASVPILKNNGIAFARTMRPGVNTARTDPYLLCRAPVDEATAAYRIRMDLLQAAIP